MSAPRSDPELVTEEPCGPHDQIVVLGHAGRRGGAPHTRIGAQRNAHPISEIDELEHGLEVVVAVRPATDDVQKQVDLRRRRQLDDAVGHVRGRRRITRKRRRRSIVGRRHSLRPIRRQTACVSGARDRPDLHIPRRPRSNRPVPGRQDARDRRTATSRSCRPARVPRQSSAAVPRAAPTSPTPAREGPPAIRPRRDDHPRIAPRPRSGTLRFRTIHAEPGGEPQLIGTTLLAPSYGRPRGLAIRTHDHGSEHGPGLKSGQRARMVLPRRGRSLGRNELAQRLASREHSRTQREPQCHRALHHVRADTGR